MAIFATAGAKFYIGGALDPDFGEPMVAADFTGQTWVQVEPLESIGSLGDSAEVVEFDAIGDGRKYKLKGVRDAGSLEIVAGLDYGNAGQVAMLAAEASSNNYAFKVTFNDAPAGGTPSERMFVGLVMSAAEALDQANSVMKVTFAIGVNSNVVRVAAAD